MKRIFFSYFLWVFCLTVPFMGKATSPWGILQETVDSDSGYGVDNLLNKTPIRYAVEQGVTPAEEQLFVDALRRWPRETLQTIQALGRSNEFKDITGLLKGVRVVKSDAATADITFKVSNDACCQSNCGGYFNSSEGNNIVLCTKNRRDARRTTIHEVGHFYGLADQYNRARQNASPTYSSNQNHQEGSMMNSQASITCDDKDGFINLIDLRLSQRNRGRFSERARNGWWSLCKETKNFYQEAKTHNRVEDIVTLDDGRKRITQYDKKGNVVRHSEGISLSFDYNPFPLFSLSPGDRITRDKQNRIEKIVSNKGSRLCPVVKGKSTRQFLYLDEDIQVLCNDVSQNILKNRLILLPNMEITVKVPASGKANAFRKEFPFDKNGYMVQLSFKNRRLSYISVIDGGTGEDGPLRAVSLEKDFNTGTFYKADVMGYQSLEYVLWDADFGSKLQHKPILPNHRAILLEMKDAYDQVAAYIPDFDKYFYQPTLDAAASQKIQQQVKNKLQR